jgi:hypothetical protein
VVEIVAEIIEVAVVVENIEVVVVVQVMVQAETTVLIHTNNKKYSDP